MDFEVKFTNELIGKKWACPFPGCGAVCEITVSGIEHMGYKHWFSMDLDELLEYHKGAKVFHDLEKKLWYGE